MTETLSIHFRHMPDSPSLEADIRRRNRHLRRFAPQMLLCEVTVTRHANANGAGNHYQVHVHVRVPGASYDTGQHARANHSHADPYIATRDAFEAMQRRLHDALRQRRGTLLGPEP